MIQPKFIVFNNTMLPNKTYKIASRADWTKIIYSSLIMLGITLRIFAAIRNPINSHEAAILLPILDDHYIHSASTSILETILLKASFFVFGDTEIAARMWPLLAGCGLLFIPRYFLHQNEKRFVLLLTGFLAIDPFVISNSIQIGSNIFSIFSLAAFLISIQNKKWKQAMFSLFMLIISGRGLLPAFVMVACFYLIPGHGKHHLASDINHFVKETRKVWLLPFVIVVSVAALLKVDFSSVLIDAQPLFSDSLIQFGLPVTNAGYPIVLFSYAPLPLLTLFLSIRYIDKSNSAVVVRALLAAIAAFVYLLIIPNRTYSDLVWVILPIIVGAASSLASKWEFDFSQKEKMLLLIASLVGLISFSLSLGNFIARGNSGVSQLNVITSLLTTLLLFVIGYVYFLYMRRGKEFVHIFTISLLILFLFIQVSFAFRSSGLENDHAKEILWDGMLIDIDTFSRIYHSMQFSKEESSDSIQIAVEDSLSPQYDWVLRNENVSRIPNGANILRSDAVITDTQELEITGLYIGQPINAFSFPEWIKSPVYSLFDYDYWSWLLFRESRLSYLKDYFWKAMN